MQVEPDFSTGESVGQLEIIVNHPTLVQPSYGEPVAPAAASTPHADSSFDGYSPRTREILARVQRLLAGQGVNAQPDLLTSVAETIQTAEPRFVSSL